MANSSLSCCRVGRKKLLKTTGHWKISLHHGPIQHRKKTCNLWYKTIRDTWVKAAHASPWLELLKEHEKIKERSNTAFSFLIIEFNGFFCIIGVFWTRNFVSSPALQTGSNWTALSNIPLAIFLFPDKAEHIIRCHTFFLYAMSLCTNKIVR